MMINAETPMKIPIMGNRKDSQFKDYSLVNLSSGQKRNRPNTMISNYVQNMPKLMFDEIKENLKMQDAFKKKNRTEVHSP